MGTYDSQEHDNNKHRPSHRNDVDGVTKNAEIKVGPCRQDFAASNKDNHDGNSISNLEADSTTAYNCLKSIVTSEYDKAQYQVDDKHACQRAKRDSESIADIREP